MEALIILHGWQSSKEKWREVKREIEGQGIKVIVPDLPGFKKENELKKAWNLDDYVEWVAKFAKGNIKEPFFLLGHSFGGRVAIKFAAKYPERLKGLILVSAGGVEAEKTLKELTISILAPYLKKFSFLPGYRFLREFFYRFILRKTDYLRAKGFLKETFKKVIQEDLVPLLGKIESGALIIWGEKDKILPLRDAHIMNQKIKNSKLEILRNIGHNPHLKNPKLLSQKITNFIISQNVCL